MTTIILVSIGVLIAAAAALFIVFYGGDAFSVGEKKAEAARLVSEGQQISNATTLFYHQVGRLPGQDENDKSKLNSSLALKELLDNDYIDKRPVGAKLTNKAEWAMEYGTDGMIYSKLGTMVDQSDPAISSEAKSASTAALDVCREARRQLEYKDVDANGDLKVYKCDGSDYPRAHPAGTLPDREPCCVRVPA